MRLENSNYLLHKPNRAVFSDNILLQTGYSCQPRVITHLIFLKPSCMRQVGRDGL